MTNRRSFFASLTALPAAVFGVFQAKPAAAGTAPMRVLYARWGKFPVGMRLGQASDAVDVLVPDAPPLSGRNANWCFGTDPFDEVRLAEVLAFFQGIGFCVQMITVERPMDDFGMATIRFGQIADPRVPEASNTSPIPIRTSPFKNR